MTYSLLWVTVRVAASLCLRGDASLLLTRDSCCLWVSKTHRPSFGLRAVLKVSLGSSLTCVENEGETETRGKTAKARCRQCRPTSHCKRHPRSCDRSVPNNSGVLEPKLAGFRGSAS